MKISSLLPSIIAFCACPIALSAQSDRPEPSDWHTGDIHVHRNCGGGTVLSEDRFVQMMEVNDIEVVSMLADMGNGEVKDSKTDLMKVSGKDAPQRTASRIIHWDTEWHWDATYSNFSNQALGGHLVLLGLNHANQIWEESPYKILDWAKQQQAVRGFAHMEYLNNHIQDTLNCCIPIDYPVEAVLKNIDFVSEDVYGTKSPNNGNYNSEAAIQAYYRLLNCGIPLALAAGTDYPCNDDEPWGTLLTYVRVKGPLTYDAWINGIKKGNTVVSRNGHQEFLQLSVNKKIGAGDTLQLKKNHKVEVSATWTSKTEQSGKIEIVCNGKVVASQPATASPGKPATFTTSINVDQSSWICARRMNETEHVTHTSAAYVLVGNRPVRASKEDAQYFVEWIDNILRNIAPGGKWNRYFPNDLATIQQRYQKAREAFNIIASESAK